MNTGTREDIFWGKARTLTRAELDALTVDELLDECARSRVDVAAAVEACREARGTR